MLGGRNDLLQYFFNGRRVVFEVFGSAGQVPQDLRLLERSDAAVKIAILIDRDVDDAVSRQYFRKRPDAFPFLWLQHVLEPGWEAITIARLRELIDEKHSIIRLRRLISGSHADAVDRTMQGILGKIEERLAGAAPPSLPRLNGKQVIALHILGLVKGMGVPVERLRSLFQWLVESVDYALLVMRSGFQAFLITDLQGRHAICSDADLADDLIVGQSDTPTGQVVICLNPIVNAFLTRNGHAKAKLRFHFFHSYSEFIERVIPKKFKEAKAKPGPRRRKSGAQKGAPRRGNRTTGGRPGRERQ